MTEPGAIRLTEYIPHPPEKVWRALTEPALHARWWAAGDIRPVVGHKFTLDMGHWGQQPCEVMAVETNRVLTLAFALDTTITYRLEAEGAGTRLHFEHAGFDLDSPLAKQAFEGMGRGWPGILKRLEVALNDSGI